VNVRRPEDSEVIPRWARDWQATLFDHGWMIPGYPPELGGRNATPVQTLVYLEEMAARGIPRSVHFPGYAIVAPTLLEFGTEEQRALAPAAIRGDTVWCIGMSEPNAGSDLAGLQTRAVLDGDRFVINGQKVWTSYASESALCCCYVRTDPDAPKHKGISLLIVDMKTPGIEIRPLRHLNGHADFAEVFFTDVEVPRANLVGDLNDGWRLTQGSLAHERAGLWVESVTRMEQSIAGLVDLARKLGVADDAVVRRRVGEAYQRASSLRALGYKGFTSFAQGSSAPEHSYLKLASSELGKAIFELGMDIQGPYGPVTDQERSYDAGRWVLGMFMSFANTIAGGSSEIQRNIIAQRVLGLPR
jgi:alkylation response protein AidB-like acyl-CoA dehydrogenase